MGTINYGTSNYITIGYNLDWDDSDFETWEEMENEKQLDIEDMYTNIQAILNKYGFAFYHIAIKHGYYEGFYIDIENNYPICYDTWNDKQAALKEATQIKRFLLECIDMGLCEVWPGWCTSYKSRNESINAIKQAIRGMKEEIRAIPTWEHCRRLGIEV